MSKGVGGHQSSAALSEVWLTPPEIIRALGTFDLDPCAAPPPRPWDTASSHIALPEDGLAADWWGRVWVNPPYGRKTRAWLARLADHGRGTALIFARTETEMFISQVWERADAVMFLYGRLHFHRPDGTRARANAGAPSVLVAYGEEDVEALRSCGLSGRFLRLTSPVGDT